jgi:hypothetical protein
MAGEGLQVTPKQPPYRGGLNYAMDHAIEDKLRFARTMVPAKVLKVDYDKSLVNIKPLIRFRFDMATDDEYGIEEILEVPLIFSSAKRGIAKMTFPVREGDVGLLLCSDRHTENFRASDGISVVDSGSFSTLGTDGYINYIGFIPEVFTSAIGESFDPNDVVLVHGSCETRHKENGTVVTTNESSTVTQKPSGEISLVNGGGYIKLLADGRVDINGFIIQTSGAATSPVSVGAPTVAAETSLVVNGKEMDGHNHSEGTYQVGGDNVSGESGDPV